MEKLELLLDRESRFTAKPSAAPVSTQSTVQTADKGASLYDFIKMVSRLVILTMSDLEVEFIPDEGRTPKLDPNEPIDHPYLTYKVISRVPKDELKPRVRQTIMEEGNERIGEIYGQKFKCVVQFNVFASVYDAAEQVMERFEELILSYTGHLKKNGVAEILFKQQLTDSSYDIFRQTMSVRNFQLYIEVEKLTVLFREKINEIETRMRS